MVFPVPTSIYDNSLIRDVKKAELFSSEKVLNNKKMNTNKKTVHLHFHSSQLQTLMCSVIKHKKIK